jgi:hypothetical protein
LEVAGAPVGGYCSEFCEENHISPDDGGMKAIREQFIGKGWIKLEVGFRK